MSKEPQYVLCGNCLAVSEYSDAKHNEDEFCSCGGAWCGCDGCNDMILNPENWFTGVKLEQQKTQFLLFQKGFAPLVVRVPVLEHK